MTVSSAAETSPSLKLRSEGRALRDHGRPEAAIPDEIQDEEMQTVAMRRSSDQTGAAGTEMKRQKTDSEITLRRSLDSSSNRSLDPRQEEGRARRQTSEIEREKLEKIALKELRRLDREDRMERAKVGRDSQSSSVADSTGKSSSSASSAHQPGVPSASPGAEPANLENIVELEEEEEQSLFQSPNFFVELKAMQDSFMAKPAKAKNGEFNMKNANPAERAGFGESDGAS